MKINITTEKPITEPTKVKIKLRPERKKSNRKLAEEYIELLQKPIS